MAATKGEKIHHRAAHGGPKIESFGIGNCRKARKVKTQDQYNESYKNCVLSFRPKGEIFPGSLIFGDRMK